MRIRRSNNKTNMTRPRKGGADKRRRQADQRKRLIALGVDEAVVAKMNPLQVRTLLKRPAQVAKAHQQ